MATLKNYEGEIGAKLSDYRTLGQKEASKHRPPSGATAPDQHEVALRTEAEAWVATEQQLLDHAVTEASRSVVEARQKAVELQAEGHRLLSDDSLNSTVSAELANDKAALVRASEARMRAEVDLKFFRERNGIHEEAQYPESLPWHFGVLAVLVLVEVLVNAFFYENSQGLLGGVIVAFGIAALNMGSAMFFGGMFRYWHMPSTDKKVIGGAMLVAFIVSAVFCNALFAAFRSEYQLVMDPSENAQVREAFSRAWPEAVLIYRLDMQFQDHWSFVLFGVGILLSIAAFYKGYTIGDKYPGHAPLDKRYRKTQEEEVRQQDLVRQKVKELLHQRRAAVQAVLHEPTTQMGMLARRISEVSHARKSMEGRAAAVERDYVRVIGAYRQANLAVRGIDSPAYFKDDPVLLGKVDGSQADSVSTELTQVQSELDEMAKQQREGLNARLNTLQHDAATILNESVGAFLAEARKEAQENISRLTPSIRGAQAVV